MNHDQLVQRWFRKQRLSGELGCFVTGGVEGWTPGTRGVVPGVSEAFLRRIQHPQDICSPQMDKL